MDTVMRAKVLSRQITEGLFPHNDTLRYQLYLESVVIGGKPTLTRTDIRGIISRIKIPDACDNPKPQFVAESLPGSLFDMVKRSKCCKIEWMFNGKYHVSQNSTYKANFVNCEDIKFISESYGIAPKLVDWSGFDRCDYVFRAWLESMTYPGFTFTYTGACLWKEEQEVEYSTVHIQTYMYNPVCMITVTSVTKATHLLF
jgi:hypothetical protein